MVIFSQNEMPRQQPFVGRERSWNDSDDNWEERSSRMRESKSIDQELKHEEEETLEGRVFDAPRTQEGQSEQSVQYASAKSGNEEFYKGDSGAASLYAMQNALREEENRSRMHLSGPGNEYLQ